MKKIILVSLVILTLILAASPVMAAEPEKALIIYFDYSENINTEGVDIDAVSQASIAEPERYRDRSNVLVMADMLKERTGAEVYALHITEPYAPKFEDMVDGAQTDKNENRQFSFAHRRTKTKTDSSALPKSCRNGKSTTRSIFSLRSGGTLCRSRCAASSSRWISPANSLLTSASTGEAETATS